MARRATQPRAKKPGKQKPLRERIRTRIRRKQASVFLRKDFSDLSRDYDQVGRALRDLVAEGELVRIGYGLYARARTNSLTGQLQPELPLPQLGREALQRLNVGVADSSWTIAYNMDRTTQVPTGRLIAVDKPVQRRIGYDGMYISYEYTAA